MRRALTSEGFTLLEVMVATAILGLTLTVILSAQGGLAASNKSSNQMGTAISLGRCKMTEVEEKLLKFGYADIDDVQTEVPCCNDETVVGYICDYRADKVLLPNPPTSSVGGDGGAGGSMALSTIGSGMGSGLGSSSLGSAISGLNPQAGGALDLNGGGDGGGLAQLNLDGGIQDLGAQLTQQMGGGGMGTQGLLSMVMGLVYPFTKPMMEASIRKLTVVVRWKEGSKVKEFTLLQYVTNPSNGGFGGASPSASASSGAHTPSSTVPAH